MSQEQKHLSSFSSSSSAPRPQDTKFTVPALVLPKALPLGDAKVAALLKPVKTNLTIKPRFSDMVFANEIFAEPHSCDAGDVYEWEQMTHWLKTHDTNPKTNEILEHKKLRPAKDKQEDVQEFLDEHPELRDCEELYLPRHWVKELEQACQEGNIATIKRLCERDKRLLRWTFHFDKAEGLVDSADYARWHGKNMLHLACQSGTRDAVVQLVTLLEKYYPGLALHVLLQTDSEGHLPLHYALNREQEATISLTLMAWMKQQWHNLSLPLALLGKADAKGHRMLHHAVLTGAQELVKWLLTQKVTVGAQNHLGQTALYLAALADHEEMLQLLLQPGMALATQDQAGNTALHLAAASGSQTTLAALLRAGSSQTLKNNAGQTAREAALDAATAACYDLVTTQLREKEANALKAHGPLGLILLQQQELIRQLQAELGQQKNEMAQLKEVVAKLMPSSSPQKASHSSSGFGLFDEKRQAPAAQPVVDEKALGQLLKCVAEGEQDQAESLIKQDAKLLLAAGKVTDLSGRSFDHVTAFQYALWAMDYHMWTMLQKHLPAEAQAEQHQVLESKGTAHGKHFDLQPLLGALKTYVDNAAGWNYDQRAVDQWCKKVGGAQKLLPAHVVNEYARADRPFDPCPKEWESSLPRTRMMVVYDGSKWENGEWFTPPSSNMSLGNSFALARGRRRGAGGGAEGRAADLRYSARRWRLPPVWMGRAAEADLESLQALWNARTEQLKLLAVTLSEDPTQSSVLKFN